MMPVRIAQIGVGHDHASPTYDSLKRQTGLFELVARSVMGLFVVPKFGFNAVCLAHPSAWIMADLILIALYSILMKRLDGQPVRKES